MYRSKRTEQKEDESLTFCYEIVRYKNSQDVKIHIQHIFRGFLPRMIPGQKKNWKP